MAGGGGGRSLEETPTWAVAVVCFVLLAVSLVIEYIIHLIGQWLKSKHKRSLAQALEKIKSELMMLGFISLLLSAGQGLITGICISEKVAATWHPCDRAPYPIALVNNYNHFQVFGHRILLAGEAVAAGTDKCAAKGKVSLVSAAGITQLHIFIFVLAVFHVLYCIFTYALGRAKMGKWKAWEIETRTAEYQSSHDPQGFRFARETTFGRRHLSFWTKNPFLLWIVCFFRQFVRSVPKVDYLTLRHGFIMAHLDTLKHTNFDFQKYINRSLEKDFKVVVGISPPIWLFAVIFLLFNTHGWYSYWWMPFIPLIIVLLVGTKLQVIITRMGLKIQERGELVKGLPVVQPGDDLFWFNRPRLILYLINFVLFQNAFQLAFFIWTWYEFGLRSCFYNRKEDIIIRISMGVLILILCSYVTLPLHALVSQMGSSLKPTILDEKEGTGLKDWQHTSKKHGRKNKYSDLNISPLSSTSTTPTQGLSPVHLLRYYKSELDSYPNSPVIKSNYDIERLEAADQESSSYQNEIELANYIDAEEARSRAHPLPPQSTTHIIQNDEIHEIDIGVTRSSKEFSFDKYA